MHEQIAEKFLNSPEGAKFRRGDDSLYGALGSWMATQSHGYNIPNPVPIAEAVQKILSDNKQGK